MRILCLECCKNRKEIEKVLKDQLIEVLYASQQVGCNQLYVLDQQTKIDARNEYETNIILNTNINSVIDHLMKMLLRDSENDEYEEVYSKI